MFVLTVCLVAIRVRSRQHVCVLIWVWQIKVGLLYSVNPLLDVVQPILWLFSPHDNLAESLYLICLKSMASLALLFLLML